MSPIDYVIIGHVCRDRTPSGPAFGGTAAYAGRTALAHGWRVGVITSTGPDWDPRFALDGALLMNLPAERTTEFENLYTPHGRRQRLHGLAERLLPAAVPLEWRRPRVVHLAPVAGEVDPSLLFLFEGALRGITPQGWMRAWDEAGHVYPRPWAEAEQFLPHADAVVFSEEDIQGDWELAHRWARRTSVLVVTQAARGATLFQDGIPHPIPAYPVQEVDPTGAGDVFAAAFFIRLWETRDPLAAAHYAARVAALSVTRPGLEGTPRPEEIEAIRREFPLPS
ncbi:PfkB family carbohydrate kinase [Thermoflexus sp.]|uniref:PfkB family carbohydrate kinase n=1 Tax=Thermoflexus sp. TaxID=1969742 RepID=UPI0035E43B53